MSKIKVTEADSQPDELGELKVIVDEFVRRLQAVDADMDMLKEDRKGLIEEFSSQCDIKTLRKAMQIVKIKRESLKKHTLDTFLHILEKDPTDGS